MEHFYPLFMIFSCLLLAFSVVIFVNIRKRRTKLTRIFHFVLGCLVLLFSAFLSAGMVVRSNTMLAFAFFFFLGGLCVYNGCFTWIQWKSCRLRVVAKCTQIRASSGGGLWFVPYVSSFSYRMNHCEMSATNYRIHFRKKFKVGNEYTVYINPDEPERCVDKEGLPYDTILITAFGVVLIMVGIIFSCYAFF